MGYKYSKADFECVLDKVLEWEKLTPEQRFPKTHSTKTFQPDQPKDGVFEEPPKVPPKKSVWVPKPEHMKNTLDSLLGTSKTNPRLYPSPPSPRLRSLSLHLSPSLSLSHGRRPLCVTTVTVRVTLRSFASGGSGQRGWRGPGATRTSSTRRAVDLLYLGAQRGEMAGRVV